MKQFAARTWPIGLALLVVIAWTALAHAQPAGGYELTWSTVDNGGGLSLGGGYALAGTISQPDAGTLTGGSYTLTGGFWTGISTDWIALLYQIYLPLVVRSD